MKNNRKLYRCLLKTWVVIIAIAGTPAIAHEGGRREVKVIPADGLSMPYGKTYGDWGAEWWKWALSSPFDQSPITDPDGRFGSKNQKGPVWFLAGTFGTTAKRSITIPSGKAVFFPIVNMWNDWPCPDASFKPTEGHAMYWFLAKGVKPFIDPWDSDSEDYAGSDNTLSASASVDGGVTFTPLTYYRDISGLARFKADPTQIAGDTCITGEKQLGVANGYWTMLAPLKPGKYVIKFSASAKEKPSAFSLDVTYDIQVEKSEHY